MKLANALSQRSELQERIRQLEGRLLNNAKVQEGEVPAEDPQELLKELEEHYAQLERYIAAINRTNSRTLVEGVPLSDLLARRDCWKKKLQGLRDFLDCASELAPRRTVGEIKIRSKGGLCACPRKKTEYLRRTYGPPLQHNQMAA